MSKYDFLQEYRYDTMMAVETGLSEEAPHFFIRPCLKNKSCTNRKRVVS